MFKKITNFITKRKKSTAVMMLMAVVLAMAVPAGAAPIDFSDTTVDIPVTDVVGSGISFMGIFNEYILLGLGILFAGIIIGFIFWVIQKARRAAPGSK